MEISIDESNICMDDIIHNCGLTSESQHRIQESDIIILPSNFIQNRERRSFPVESIAFIKHLRQRHPEIKISFFENQNEEKCKVLRSEICYLPTLYFCLKDIALPIVIALVMEYLRERYRGNPKIEQSTAELSLLIENEDGSRRFLTYNGPITELPRIIETVNREKLGEIDGNDSL